MVRRGLGGTHGDGRQYVSWIHEQDFIRAVYWLIERSELEGPVNLTSPNPVPNAEFMRTLRHAWRTRFGLPATKWLLEIGAFFLRTETELILKSRRVVPGRLLQSGFTFQSRHGPTPLPSCAVAGRRYADASLDGRHSICYPADYRLLTTYRSSRQRYRNAVTRSPGHLGGGRHELKRQGAREV
jgi:hypothetical protein